MNHYGTLTQFREELWMIRRPTGELNRDELETLRRINRSPTTIVSRDMAESWGHLGVADRRLGGIGVSREGKKLLRRGGRPE